MSDHPVDHAGADDGVPVVVFWRPGCGFCAALMRALDRMGLDHERRNIWEDEGAAAALRAVAGGSETVPTVLVGERALVDPTLDQVMAAVADLDPTAVPDGWTPRARRPRDPS